MNKASGQNRSIKHFLLYGLAWGVIIGGLSWLNVHGALHH